MAGSLEKENKRGEKQKAIDKLTAELEKVKKDSRPLKPAELTCFTCYVP